MLKEQVKEMLRRVEGEKFLVFLDLSEACGVGAV